MNKAATQITLILGLLALGLAAVPAHAERYIVEPIVDAADSQGFSQPELDQMLAPIALYPDSLLSQVLIAATYPLEVVQAARWSRQNPRLEGEQAVAAVADREWDPSVKALVAFPELLAQLDEDLDWTRNLGDAMLFQEDQVMDSIQFLRARADAAGSLENTEYVRVIREEKTIIIEPAQPRVVYVPYYDPHVVYGTWWRPAYPPVYWARPPFYHYGHAGFYWGTGVRLSSGFFYSSFYWPQRSIIIVNTPRYYTPPRHRPYRSYYAPGQTWKHNPVHRRGVSYRQPDVRERYSDYSGTRRPATRPGSGSRTRALVDGGQHELRTGPVDQVRNERLSRESSAIERRLQSDGAEQRRRTGSTVTPRSSDSASNRFTTRSTTPAPTANAPRQSSSRQTTPQQPREATSASIQQRLSAPARTSQATRSQATPRSGSTVTRTPQATRRATAPTRAPQATQRQALPTQRQSAHAPSRQSQPQSTRTPSAAPAPAPQSRATGRSSSSRERETRAPSRSESRGNTGRSSTNRDRRSIR